MIQASVLDVDGGRIVHVDDEVVVFFLPAFRERGHGLFMEKHCRD